MITEIIETLARTADSTLRNVLLAACVKPLRRKAPLAALENYSEQGQLVVTIIEQSIPEIIMFVGIEQLYTAEEIVKDLVDYLESNSGQEVDMPDMATLHIDWNNALVTVDEAIAEMLSKATHSERVALLVPTQKKVAAYAVTVRLLLAYRMYRMFFDLNLGDDLFDGLGE